MAGEGITCLTDKSSLHVDLLARLSVCLLVVHEGTWRKDPLRPRGHRSGQHPYLPTHGTYAIPQPASQPGSQPVLVAVVVVVTCHQPDPLPEPRCPRFSPLPTHLPACLPACRLLQEPACLALTLSEDLKIGLTPEVQAMTQSGSMQDWLPSVLARITTSAASPQQPQGPPVQPPHMMPIAPAPQASEAPPARIKLTVTAPAPDIKTNKQQQQQSPLKRTQQQKRQQQQQRNGKGRQEQQEARQPEPQQHQKKQQQQDQQARQPRQQQKQAEKQGPPGSPSTILPLSPAGPNSPLAPPPCSFQHLKHDLNALKGALSCMDLNPAMAQALTGFVLMPDFADPAAGSDDDAGGAAPLDLGLLLLTASGPRYAFLIDSR